MPSAIKEISVRVVAIAPWWGSTTNPDQSTGAAPVLQSRDVTLPSQSIGFGAIESVTPSAPNPSTIAGATFGVVLCFGSSDPVISSKSMPGSASGIESEQQLLDFQTVIGAFSAYPAARTPTMDGFTQATLTVPVDGVDVTLTVNSAALKAVPGLKEKMNAACKACSAGFEVTPGSVTGQAPNLNMEVESQPGRSGSETITLQIRSVAGGWELVDYANAATARTAADAAVAAHQARIDAGLAAISMGKSPNTVPGFDNVLVRPLETYSPDLLPKDRALMDEWWMKFLPVGMKLAGQTQGASTVLADQYAARDAADTGLTFDEWFVKTQRGGVQTPIAAQPATSSNWFEHALGTLGSATGSALKWAGDSVVDVAKSWGPAGTMGAVAAGSLLTSNSLGNLTPWLIGGALLLLVK